MFEMEFELTVLFCFWILFSIGVVTCLIAMYSCVVMRSTIWGLRRSFNNRTDAVIQTDISFVTWNKSKVQSGGDLKLFIEN